jgi:hypothetical protein
VVVGYAIAITVARLQNNKFPEIRVDMLDVQWMNWKALFVALARSRHDAEARIFHEPSIQRGSSRLHHAFDSTACLIASMGWLSGG